MARHSENREKYRNKNRLSGSALMELILAVTIIGVFIGIALQIGNKIRSRMDIAADRMLLSTLALECSAVLDEGNADLSGVTDMKSFAVVLAKAGGPNDIAWYQSRKRRNKKHMNIVVGGQQNAALRNVYFDFIAVKPNDNPTGRDVLFCTRGIAVGGRWDLPDSLYGHAGGLVTFRDGHTEWASEHTGAAAHLALWYD